LRRFQPFAGQNYRTDEFDPEQIFLTLPAYRRGGWEAEIRPELLW
jgi:hypothetical protein